MNLLSAALLGGFLLSAPALAQEVHHHAGQSRAVDEFISTWKMPRDRSRSCCSHVDCAPAEAKFMAGMWWAKRATDGQWRPVPAGDVETERDSPDGRSYLCASNYGPETYCFLPSAGN